MPYRATLDVPERPVTPLHFTVEPPGGATRLGELGDDQLRSVAVRLRELATALAGAHGCGGFNLFVNDGRYGRQSTGEVPEEDRWLRFHVLGRRADEAVAPSTILNAPDDFALERVGDAERTARLDRLAEANPAAAGNPGASGAAVSPGTGGTVGAPGDRCPLCGADEAADHQADGQPAGGQQEVLRGDTARVLRPRRPLTPTNVMLAPLRHVEHLAALTDDEFVGLFRLFDRVRATFGQVHGCTSYNLFTNDGKAAGQHVPHLHVHVFGRSEGEETNPYELLRGLRFNLRR